MSNNQRLSELERRYGPPDAKQARADRMHAAMALLLHNRELIDMVRQLADGMDEGELRGWHEAEAVFHRKYASDPAFKKLADEIHERLDPNAGRRPEGQSK